MQPRYKSHFEQLNPEETEYVSKIIGKPAKPDLFSACAPYDQADVILFMSDSAEQTAVNCMEKLVGKPIVRAAPKLPAKEKKQRKRYHATDGNIIREIQPNPKKPGSAAYLRYELYRDGMSVEEYILAGGKRSGVKWDIERGFIKLMKK